MSEFSDFPCTRCGACCRSVANNSTTDFLNRGDGVCKYLNDSTNLCSIYENRPDICRVDLQYKINYQKYISWDKFSELNQKACIILQKNLSN